MLPLNIEPDHLKKEKKRKDHFKDILLKPKRLEIRTLDYTVHYLEQCVQAWTQFISDDVGKRGQIITAIRLREQ